MGGRVIETLCNSSVLAGILAGDEFRILANCGSMREYRRGETIAEAEDERVFVLHRGRVALHLCVFSESGRCGGEANLELNETGQVFGWGAWVRSDRISASALALESVCVVALNLKRLHVPEMSTRLRLRMLQILYGLLQEWGLCPPNIRALLAFSQFG